MEKIIIYQRNQDVHFNLKNYLLLFIIKKQKSECELSSYLCNSMCVCVCIRGLYLKVQINNEIIIFFKFFFSLFKIL